jgi:nucleotide-binding universal stress UspA family protein
MFTPKTILVPTDFSQSSDMALEKAVDLAEKYNAKLFCFMLWMRRSSSVQRTTA